MSSQNSSPSPASPAAASPDSAPAPPDSLPALEAALYAGDFDVVRDGLAAAQRKLAERRAAREGDGEGNEGSPA